MDVKLSKSFKNNYISFSKIKVQHSAHIMLYYKIPIEIERTKIIQILDELYPKQKYINGGFIYEIDNYSLLIDDSSKSERESSSLFSRSHKITNYNSMVIYKQNENLCFGGFSYYNNSSSVNLNSIDIDDNFFVGNMKLIIDKINY